MIILVAEDDENDAFLLKRAFDKYAGFGTVRVCLDGQETIAYLQGTGPFQDRSVFPFPNVVITDLKMPRVNGFQVIEWLRQDSACQALPILVLSSSKEEQDVEKAYALGANSYLVKPGTLRDLEDLVKTTLGYWNSCAKPNYADQPG